MAESALVEFDIEGGKKLVQLLDTMNVEVRGAMWVYHSDTDRWRLLVFTDAVNGEGRLKDLLLQILKAGAPLDLGQVDFRLTKDPLLAGVAKFIGVSGIGGVRVTKNMFDGIYLEDAYIYRSRV